MTPQETLLKAADLIEQRGWFDGKHDGPGLVCASTAITEVAGYGESSAAHALLLGHLNTQSDDTVDALDLVFDWNDSQPNFKAVTDAMRKAARA